MDDFKLGNPTLVCRWRLAQRSLPLKNRHLRALAQRRIDADPMSPNLVAWVAQHLEWTLEDGAAMHPDGVLMLVVDEEGRAAMTVGPYEPLNATSSNDLLRRACVSWREAATTGVSPEDLWVVRDNTLVWGTSPDFSGAGASTLIADLALTMGMPVIHDEDLLATATTEGISADEVFLVSDEHGVVPASDRTGTRSEKFRASYLKLFDA